MDSKSDRVTMQPQFDLLPPIFTDVVSELKGYIECPEKLPIHQVENCQCYWEREPDILSIADFDLAPLGTTIKFHRNAITGQIGEMWESSLEGVGKTARNSMSMTRAPEPLVKGVWGVMGNDSNFPFLPGGFEEPKISRDISLTDIDFENNLRTLAKGFSSGIEFENDNCTPKGKRKETEELAQVVRPSTIEKVNLMAIVHREGSVLGSGSLADDKIVEDNEEKHKPLDKSKTFIEDGVEALLDNEQMPRIPIINTSEEAKSKTQTKWAEQLDVSLPVTDFEKKVPDPAMTFEYELDIFQKQAILKLEEGSNVFVAAHTSAGKTTVAEYAIALSQKHLTRVIYTSPIKALSNQKYRDFKRKFESVGLLTGDLQINQTASCLIMTTEILQSMLYCASEVLRDLEYVIFDEVHYINNEDRGHVWEEIVILLPQNVNIVMLSATVPNPLMFADWVGRIKRKKMYVISTLKRPVPLIHYLYTGIDGLTRDNRYLILDAEGQLSLDGWYKANKSLEKTSEKNEKAQKKQGDHRKNKPMSKKQEEAMWIPFIDHLRKCDLLPVVVFTFSRKRCDKNAAALTSLDLTTAREKHHVYSFFQNRIKHLKGSDRELPQVNMMQKLLEKGIGIHHSGILPILKEIIEMLFQSGVVKLLFATETFAMGVNMPARTVAFDSVLKYDGNEFRALHPTEYIQMAGRAGRRGHDKTGTVIILCRKGIPLLNELKSMMCGKAQSLESKFKITYSMVLNLRRVNEAVTVEAMMRRSFKESALAAQETLLRNELEKLDSQIANLPTQTDLQKKLANFYDVAVDYLEEMKFLKPHMLEGKKCVKNLTEGRVLIVSHAYHYNKLAVILEVTQRQQSRAYKVLLLTDSCPSQDATSVFAAESESVKWHTIIGLIKKDIYVPSGVPSHQVLTIAPHDILEITNCTIKFDYGTVIKDWENRQIARFKESPPGPTCRSAVQELMSLSMKAAADPSVLLPYTKMNLNFAFMPRVQHLAKLKSTLDEMKCMEIANFEQHFQQVFRRSELESKRRHIQLQLSDEGMALYPNYVNMVAILKRLGYIDNDERVALKGRVALQMGNNELLITELILKNTLTVLRPSEIAALLSAIIFQQRSEVQPETITPALKNACKVIEEIHDELSSLERQYQLSTLQPLNFGLIEVVYDWAEAKSFADIMKKTDVQEGIIVRCIQQLSETLRDVKSAAVTIGDPVLREKMDEASAAIKRDIVFAASLYTQD